jgi:hypothetical protein
MQLEGTMGGAFGDEEDNSLPNMVPAGEVEQVNATTVGVDRGVPDIKISETIANLAAPPDDKPKDKDKKANSPWLWVGGAAVLWFLFLKDKENV